MTGRQSMKFETCASYEKPKTTFGNNSCKKYTLLVNVCAKSAKQPVTVIRQPAMRTYSVRRDVFRYGLSPELVKFCP